MNKSFLNSLRMLVVVLLCTGGAFALAFNAPTATPPGNNVSMPINNSSTPQKKGNDPLPIGSLLHIGGTTSANRFFVWNDATIVNDVTVDSLRQSGWTTGLRPVCIDTNSKLILCASSCGNTFIESGEQCDDGNTTSGDGCSNTCQTEAAPMCGNNLIESGEQCDDGNTTSGDGCSNTCQTEAAPEYYLELSCGSFGTGGCWGQFENVSTNQIYTLNAPDTTYLLSVPAGIYNWMGGDVNNSLGCPMPMDPRDISPTIGTQQEIGNNPLPQVFTGSVGCH